MAEMPGTGNVIRTPAFETQIVVGNQVGGLAVQDVDAARKLFRQPFVVGVQKGDKGAAGRQQPEVAGGAGAEIFLAQNSDRAGTGVRGVLLGNRQGPVARPVIDHHNFMRRHRLRQHAVDGAAQRRLRLVCRDDDTDIGGSCRIDL